MPLTKEKILNLSARLITRRDQLQNPEKDKTAGTSTVELDQTSVGRLSRMDALQSQAMSIALREREKLELQKIFAALRRIESGDYGYCVQCGESVADKRLEFDPATPLCINCASKAESE